MDRIVHGGRKQSDMAERLSLHFTCVSYLLLTLSVIHLICLSVCGSVCLSTYLSYLSSQLPCILSIYLI